MKIETDKFANVQAQESRYPRLRTIISFGYVSIGIIASALVAGYLYSSFTYQVQQGLKERLHNIVSITALEIDGDIHASIRDVEAENDPNYIKYQTLLNSILASDNELIYIYTMRQMGDGTIFFILDTGNDPTIAEYEFDLPGVIAYDEPSELLLSAFASPSGTVIENEIYTDEYGSFLSAYAPIYKNDGSLDAILAVDIAADAVIAKERSALLRVLAIFILSALITIIIGLILGHRLASPIVALTAGVNKIAAGNLEPISNIPTRNFETFQLFNAFNAMTAQLDGILNDLELRVSERTAELEAANKKSQRRAAQFEALSQVARNISTSQNLDSLLPQITNVISEQFGYYHIGIFMLDKDREFAVLRAANSPGGQKMLAGKHQLKVGETGIVGFVTGQGEARIAVDTGADAVYFDNPDLPDTRSEIALPLIVSNQVIGALDVQSVESDAFSQEDVNTLSTLADQVSIAIQNSRLYEEMQEALTQSQILLQQFTQVGWSKFTRKQKVTGIHRSNTNTTLLTEPLTVDELNGNNTLCLPIILRGQKIGDLKVSAHEKNNWTQDEIDIASAIIERAAIAMENARLFEETTRRAERERLVSDITLKIRSTNDPEAMIQTALDELKQALGASKVQIIPQTIQKKETQQQFKNRVGQFTDEPSQKSRKK